MLKTLRAVRITALLVIWSTACVAIHHVLTALCPGAVARFHLIYFRGINRIINIRIYRTGEIATPGPLLITANHTSWLDIHILASLMPLAFVAKSEVAGWPVFGYFAKWHRSVFIERGRRRSTLEVNGTLARRFADGETIVLFAEGTSSDGNRVLPFKSAVIGAAEHAAREFGADAVRVQPLALAYTRLRGMIMDRRDRPYFAWTGDLELAPHMWNAFKKGPIDVVIAAGRVHKVSDYANRKEMTAELERECRELLMGALLTRQRTQVAHEPMEHAQPHASPAPG